MKPTTQPKKTKTNKNRIIVLSLLAIFAVITAFSSWYIYTNFIVNYAKNEAKPIEASLVKAGATKISESGDGGHGVNNNPWYESCFELSGSKDKALEIAISAAGQEGYNLTSPSPSNNLDSTGNPIDQWYYDTSSKKSPYSELKDGHMSLYVRVPVGEQEKSCEGSKAFDPNVSVIEIKLNLPAYK